MHSLNVQQEVVPFCTGTTARCLILNWSTSKVTTLTQNHRKCNCIYTYILPPSQHNLGSMGNCLENLKYNFCHGHEWRRNSILIKYYSMFLWTKPWVFSSLRGKVETVIDRKQTSHTVKAVLLKSCQSSYKEGRTVIAPSNLVWTITFNHSNQARGLVVTKGKGAYSRTKRKH